MKIKILIGLFVVIPFFSQAQIVLNPSEVVKEFEKSSITFELIDKSYDLSKSKPILIGSGFLVLKNHIRYAVTNAHVQKIKKKDYVQVIGINTEYGKVYGEVKLITEDKTKDVAIFEYNGDAFSKKIVPDSIKSHQLSIRISSFAKDNEISPGNVIVSIGYPLNLGWDSLKNNPVVRSGIVAQEIQNNGMFLIDGMSNPGNSGSPVFDVNRKKFIGMISRGPSDRISAYDINGKLIASLPYNSGLTFCISASEILKLIP